MATPTKTTTDDVKAQLDTLSADVAELGRLVKALAGDQAEAARSAAGERAEAARAAGARVLREGRETVEESLDQVLVRMRENPGSTLAISAALGFIIGLLMAPRR